MTIELVFAFTVFVLFSVLGLICFVSSRQARKSSLSAAKKRAKLESKIVEANLRDSPGLDNFENYREWGLDLSFKVSSESLKLEMQVEGYLRSNTFKTSEASIRSEEPIELPIDEPVHDPTIHQVAIPTIPPRKTEMLDLVAKVAGAISAVCGMIAALWKYQHELKNWAVYVVLQISGNAHSIHRALGLLSIWFK